MTLGDVLVMGKVQPIQLLDKIASVGPAPQWSASSTLQPSPTRLARPTCFTRTPPPRAEGVRISPHMKVSCAAPTLPHMSCSCATLS